HSDRVQPLSLLGEEWIGGRFLRQRGMGDILSGESWADRLVIDDTAGGNNPRNPEEAAPAKRNDPFRAPHDDERTNEPLERARQVLSLEKLLSRQLKEESPHWLATGQLHDFVNGTLPCVLTDAIRSKEVVESIRMDGLKF